MSAHSVIRSNNPKITTVTNFVASRAHDTSDKSVPDNKLIFCVDQDHNRARHLIQQLQIAGFESKYLPTLPQMGTQGIPMIVDAEVLFETPNLSPFYDTPMFVVSDNLNLETRLKAVKMGATAFFSRPIDIAGISDRLEEWGSYAVGGPARILIVESSRLMGRYLSNSLEKVGMVTQVISDPLHILEPLIEFRPDLLIMGLHLPHCSGLELAMTLRQMDAYVTIPIVFLSSEEKIHTQMAAMHLGGDDFLNKDIKPHVLASTIEARVRRARVMRARVQLDGLTGLLNRTATLGQLDSEMAKAKRLNTPLCLCLIDVDHFKKVNDTHGHLVGDRVLKAIARLLRQRLRVSDIVGRFGGEEFIIILSNTDIAQAQVVMDEMRVLFTQLEFSGESVFHSSFSAGLSLFNPEWETDRWLALTDQYLYQAKANGRNQIYYV
jgi:diguanylate cyclase (GGDEF)-like protein